MMGELKEAGSFKKICYGNKPKIVESVRTALAVSQLKVP